MTLRAVLPRLSLGLAILGGALWLALNRNQIDPALIENAMRALGPWGPAAHVVLFALGTVLFVPGILFALAGGMLFGPVWGTIFNLTGATLGATAAFLAARYLTGDWVRRKAGGRLDRLIAGVEAEGWRFVDFVRLVPLVPFNLPWWDRLFGTYRDQPAAGHEVMTIGIEQFRDPAEQRLDHMLTQPFRDDDRTYALGRRESAQ